MRLLDYMDKRMILLDLNVQTKQEALVEMVKLMKENQAIKDESDLLEELYTREAQGGTSLGNGVAIPHARMKTQDRIVIAMARLAKGIDFSAEDRAPVRLIFILVTPTGRIGEYLKVLARLSKFLKDKKLLKKLFVTDSIPAAWELFDSVENQDI